jgi:hypothetical protein
MVDVSDKRSKRRQRVVLAGVIILMTGAVAGLNAFADMSPGASWRGVDIVRVSGLVALSFVLLIRSTTAFSLMGRNPALDDELTRAHRASAARVGFWVMFLGAAACLAAVIAGIAVTVQEATLALMAIGAMSAALRFSILERRADG